MAEKNLPGGGNKYSFEEFLEKYLSKRRYPGRGIILGRGTLVYFITGRSENSRNRVLRRTMDGVRTEAFDPDKLTDPSLVVYNAVRRAPEGGYVVSNGAQTDYICDALQHYPTIGRLYQDAGGIFEYIARSFSFEPDPPIHTPRISGYLHRYWQYQLSIARSFKAGERTGCERKTWVFGGGGARFISTYDDDGDPPPPFPGEPIAITGLPDDCVSAAERVWGALDRNNRVALYALARGKKDKAWRDVIINALEEPRT